MQRLFGISILAVLAAGSDVTPVQKVVQLLQGMMAKGKAEMHDEQVQYSAYEQFCTDTSASKKDAIADATARIATLDADIEQYSTTAARLSKEIAGHESDIAAYTGDIKAATNVRDMERAAYDSLHKDYSESVDALGRAIDVLKKQAYDRKQAASLAQVSALKSLSLIPAEAKRALDLFLVQTEATPEAYGYEFQSSGILGMLEQLKDKFIDERTDTEKKETNSNNAYEMLMQEMKASIEQAKKDTSEKSQYKAKQLEAMAGAKGDHADTSATKADDSKFLADLEATCAQKKTDFGSRQKLRNEELDAIQKAVDILSSGDVSGNAAKYLPSMVQQKKKTSSLAQLRAGSANVVQARAAAFLQQQGRQLNSRVLSALAARVSADPFEKVKTMIKDLIVRLMEEANEEATHKGWCDTELAKNEQTRAEKTEQVETLKAEIDGLTAEIAQLGEDIADLSDALAQLAADMKERTTLRDEESATNAATVKDAGEAQAAVAQALVVLRQFYEKASGATAFTQEHQQPVAPEIFDSPYTGMQAENGGVVGMLEVIQSDFARLEAETKASEAAAQKEYEVFMSDSKVDQAAKTTDMNHKAASQAAKKEQLPMTQTDLEETQQGLDAALHYFDKLKPSCVDAGVSYDDRVARRKEEIESLQEALRILSGDLR